jgi:hypothetical protein
MIGKVPCVNKYRAQYRNTRRVDEESRGDLVAACFAKQHIEETGPNLLNLDRDEPIAPTACARVVSSA